MRVGASDCVPAGVDAEDEIARVQAKHEPPLRVLSIAQHQAHVAVPSAACSPRRIYPCGCAPAGLFR